jgi:hypothetical protein
MMTFTSIIKAYYRFGISRTTIINYIISGKLYKIASFLNFMIKYKFRILTVEVVERSREIKSIICLFK